MRWYLSWSLKDGENSDRQRCEEKAYQEKETISKCMEAGKCSRVFKD